MLFKYTTAVFEKLFFSNSINPFAKHFSETLRLINFKIYCQCSQMKQPTAESRLAEKSNEL